MKVPTRSSAQIRSHAQKVLGSSDEDLPVPGSSGGSGPNHSMSEDKNSDKNPTEKKLSEMSEPQNASQMGSFNL